jgi:hypothetical protein
MFKSIIIRKQLSETYSITVLRLKTRVKTISIFIDGGLA